MNVENAPIYLPARALKAASYFVSTDETRYVLNGVHLCRVKDQNLVIATDGRQMLVITLARAETQAWPDGFMLTLKAEDILTMHRANGSSTDELKLLMLDEKRVHVKGCIGDTKVTRWEVIAERTDWVDRYPTWWKVLPPACQDEARSTVSLSLDAARVERISKAFGTWMMDAMPIVSLHMPEGKDGIIMVTSKSRDAVALLCHCTTNPGDRIPAFLQDAVNALDGKGAA